MPIGFHPIELMIICLFGLFGIGGTVFWIWMLVDCIQNRRLSEMTKIVWTLVIVFTHFIGALIYFFAGRNTSNQVYQQPVPGQVPYQSYQQPPQGYPPQQQPPQSYQQSYHQGYQMQQGTSSPGQDGGSVPPSEHYEKPQASYPEQQQE